MRRFYAQAENFNEQNAALGLEETRHLRDVLRLREGAKIHIFEGFGREFLCAVEKISKHKTELKIIKEVSPTASESNLNLTLAVALLKGEKFDLVIQKSVELGRKKNRAAQHNPRRCQNQRRREKARTLAKNYR